MAYLAVSTIFTPEQGNKTGVSIFSRPPSQSRSNNRRSSNWAASPHEWQFESCNQSTYCIFIIFPLKLPKKYFKFLSEQFFGTVILYHSGWREQLGVGWMTTLPNSLQKAQGCLSYLESPPLHAPNKLVLKSHQILHFRIQFHLDCGQRVFCAEIPLGVPTAS